MSDNLYPIIKIESKDEVEQLGTKEKYWIYDKDENLKKLFKIGRQNTGENWAEVIACKIGQKIGLPVASYELASYNDKLGTISTNFVLEDERLIHGNELLIKIDKEYPIDRFYKVREYKLETILILMQRLEKVKSFELTNALHDFIGYVIFDCLIANQDRHHENWGFIVEKEQKVRLAPSFDHASGFGGKVQKDEAEKRLLTSDNRYTVETFCKKGKTPFYDKALNQLSTIDACRVLAKYDVQAVCYWIDEISKIGIEEYEDMFSKIPPCFIEKFQKDFAIEILKENTKRLEKLQSEVCK